MADSLNLLDLSLGASKRITSISFSVVQNIHTLVSPANPNKNKVIIEAGISGANYSVNAGSGQGLLITSTVGSVYPVIVVLNTSDDVYVTQTDIAVGTILMMEFFN